MHICIVYCVYICIVYVHCVCVYMIHVYMIMSFKLFLNKFFLLIKIIISQIESIMKNYEIMYIYIYIWCV